MASRGPLRLAVPDFYPSPVSPTSQTPSPDGSNPGAQPRGRPSQWSSSYMRKLTRLYLYTDLPIDKIIQLIYKDSANLQQPSRESAQKKLKELLDRENRWIRAKKDADVMARVRELGHSLARIRPRHEGSDEEIRRNRSASSQFHGPFGFGSGTSQPSALDALALGALGRGGDGVGIRPEGMISSALGIVHGYAIQNFELQLAEQQPPRADSWMSNATDQTTGSFSGLLSDKTPEVRSAIKKLLKVYTMPPEEFMTDNRSTVGQNPQLVGDPQAAPPYIHQEPTLPSDFLYQSLCHEGTCAEYLPRHCQGCRACCARAAMDESDWVSAEGFTPNALRILREGPSHSDLVLKDRLGNSVLHLLAAHNINVVHSLVSQFPNHPVLHARNSAGQTFLHILFAKLSPFLGLDQPSLCHLLHEFYNAGVDVGAEDCYGRTAFHLLVWGGLPRKLVLELASRYGENLMRQRDALGLYPLVDDSQFDMDMDTDEFQDADILSATSPIMSAQLSLPITEAPGMNVPEVLTEVQLKGSIDSWLEEPYTYQDEDVDGKNPLHCLALKTISQKTWEGYADRPEFEAAFYTNDEVDSKTGPLKLRLSLLERLLEKGVNPNQYDSYGNTPLMYFVTYLPQCDDYEMPGKIIQCLIDGGARLEARNFAGETALLVAARSGNKLAVKALVHNRANVHVTDAKERGILQVVDAKMRSVNATTIKLYAKYEAIRSFLSGIKAQAVQNPNLLDEWSFGR